MTQNRNAVPHHRVDAALHAEAKTKATKVNVSLSAIATAGLLKYTKNAEETTKQQAKAKVETGNLERSQATLPEKTANTLIKLQTKNDPKFLPYLYALHQAGWSYGILATPLGVSRQAIHLRLSKYKPTYVEGLPAIPAGPDRNRDSRPVKTFDWAIWVDRDLYALATEQAAKRSEAMKDVMEKILADYIKGNLTVAATTEGK